MCWNVTDMCRARLLFCDGVRLFQVLDIVEKVSTGGNDRPRLPVTIDDCGQVHYMRTYRFRTTLSHGCTMPLPTHTNLHRTYSIPFRTTWYHTLPFRHSVI